VAQLLGPVKFGVLSLAQAVLTYFLITTDLGLKTWAIGEVVSPGGKVELLADQVFPLRLILGTLSFLILLFFVTFLEQDPQAKLVLLIFGLCVFPAALNCEWVYVGTERMQYISISWIINRGLYALLVFIWASQTASVLVVSVCWFIGTTAGTLFMLVIFWQQYKGFSFRLNWQTWRNMLSASIPMALAYFMTQVYYNFDTIMLKFMKGDEIVGWYNAAYKLVLLLIGFGGLVSTTILPSMFRLYKRSTEELGKFMHTTFRVLVVVGLPIAVSGLFFSGEIIQLVYGAEYINSVLALTILFWTVFTVFANIPFATCLLGAHRQTKYLLCVSIGAVVNLVLNFLLIPKFSLYGAAAATVITEVIVLNLLIWYSRKVIPIRLVDVLVRGCPASLVLAIFFYLVSLNLIAKAAIGFVIYIGVLFLIGGLSKDDLQWIGLMLRKNTLLENQ